MRRYCCPRTYFYPRPPRGGRLGVIGQYGHRLIFLSTPSARRATTSARGSYFFVLHFYPRPPRGGRPAQRRNDPQSLHISIHALREEGDFQPDFAYWLLVGFLSTPSARRATHDGLSRAVMFQLISIHALREEGDVMSWNIPDSRKQFLSTPSARRATKCKSEFVQFLRISIHALREEGDRQRRPAHQGCGDFYPRPPRGGRPCAPLSRASAETFLSTPSARRATCRRSLPKRPTTIISIHALREEGDARPSKSPSSNRNFYPRPPRGGRRTAYFN